MQTNHSYAASARALFSASRYTQGLSAKPLRDMWNRCRFIFALEQQLTASQSHFQQPGAELIPISAPALVMGHKLPPPTLDISRAMVVNGSMRDTILHTTQRLFPNKIPYVIPCGDLIQFGGGQHNGRNALYESVCYDTNLFAHELKGVAKRYPGRIIGATHYQGTLYYKFPPEVQKSLQVGHPLVSQKVSLLTNASTKLHVINQVFPKCNHRQLDARFMHQLAQQGLLQGGGQFNYAAYYQLLAQRLYQHLKIVASSPDKLLITVAVGQGVYRPFPECSLKGPTQSTGRVARLYRELLALPEFREVRVVFCVADIAIANQFAKVLTQGIVHFPDNIDWDLNYATGFINFLNKVKHFTNQQLTTYQNRKLAELRARLDPYYQPTQITPAPILSRPRQTTGHTFARSELKPLAAAIVRAYNRAPQAATAQLATGSLHIQEARALPSSDPRRFRLTVRGDRVNNYTMRRLAQFVKDNLGLPGRLPIDNFVNSEGHQIKCVGLTAAAMQALCQLVRRRRAQARSGPGQARYRRRR